MAATLGEKLRQAREAKGMELRDVADQTRIALNYLAAIEENNFKPLPGGIFNKGFVRSFAKAVGVDEREALADYNSLVATQLPPVDEDALTRRPDVYTNDTGGSPLAKLLGALVLLALIGVAVYFGLQYWQNRQNNAAQTLPSPTPEVAQTALPSPTPQLPSVANGLNVQIKALSEPISLSFTPDDARRPSSVLLQPNETKQFSAQQKLRLQYPKTKVNAMQMTINGSAAKIPTISDNPALRNSIIVEITRDNFAQFLQQ